MKMLRSCLFVVLIMVAAIAFTSCKKGGKLTSLTVTPADISITNGTSLQYQAQGHLSDGANYYLENVNWTSSDPNVATIEPTLGLLTASSATSAATGTITITASDPYSNFIGTTQLTVAALSSVVITPANPSMAQATGHQFTATGILANGAQQDLTSYATWSTSDASIATVASTPNVAGNGVVTAVSTTATSAAATITASFPFLISSQTGSTTLTVTNVPLSFLTITQPLNPTLSLATGPTPTVQFSVQGTYAAGGPPPADWTNRSIWSSSNTSIATIDANGLATSVTGTPGTTTITAIDPITSISTGTTLTVQ